MNSNDQSEQSRRTFLRKSAFTATAAAVLARGVVVGQETLPADNPISCSRWIIALEPGDSTGYSETDPSITTAFGCSCKAYFNCTPANGYGYDVSIKIYNSGWKQGGTIQNTTNYHLFRGWIDSDCNYHATPPGQGIGNAVTQVLSTTYPSFGSGVKETVISSIVEITSVGGDPYATPPYITVNGQAYLQQKTTIGNLSGGVFSPANGPDYSYGPKASFSRTLTLYP